MILSVKDILLFINRVRNIVTRLLKSCNQYLKSSSSFPNRVIVDNISIVVEIFSVVEENISVIVENIFIIVEIFSVIVENISDDGAFFSGEWVPNSSD